MNESEAGVVLVEALIAFVITATAVVMSFGGFAQGTRRLRAAEEGLLALAEARSLMAELSGAHTFTPSSRSGVTSSGLAWTVEIGEEELSPAPFAARPFRISVQVGMKNGHVRPVRLETYVIGRAGRE